MTCEEYYGSRYGKLVETEGILRAMAEEMKNAVCPDADLQPFVYYSSRIKKPESMERKLEARGLPVTPEAALERVFDAVGLRIVCSFANDVWDIVGKLENDSRVEILEKKDYLSHPKPNGYRSVHLCVRVKETAALAEIQVRTIAMDFWATLEHQLKYKNSVRSGGLIGSELKRCADEIASVDLTMQTIREIMKEI